MHLNDFHLPTGDSSVYVVAVIIPNDTTCVLHHVFLFIEFGFEITKLSTFLI